jgi:transposase InsO family protein
VHKIGTRWPVATRVQYIVAFEECCRKWPGLSARRFCSAAEVPYPTYARWWALWCKQGKHALLDRPRRPRRSPRALPGQVLDVIRRAHRELGWGVRRLHAYLRRAGRIRCSLSSVYRVLRRCGALVRRPRKPKPVWTRYARAVPGERAQMDLKYLPQGRYQLTLVDDCSRYLSATVLEKRTTAAVCHALRGLLNAIPFRLRCIQTDNGSEFGRDLTRLLHRLHIRHIRIRPRSPHLNGKVERVQRTVQEEFWDGIGQGSLQEWERFLQDYVLFYNRGRQHSALGYIAPMEYALQRLPRQARVSHMS